MPPHDETSPVGPRGGPARRAAPGRTGNGARRPAPGRGGRTTASRTGAVTARGRTSGKAARARRQRGRRRLRIVLAALAGLLVLAGVFVGVVYATTEVPDPNSVQNSQTTVVYYADGTTEMARLGDENRTNVGLEEISEPAQQAILAAENRNFYSDPGISLSGIIRAAWNNLTGGSTQGGSTITQQYVKNAFLTQDQTFSRKFQELFLAVKLDNQYAKDDILENYLNTIYFGRGAYGIEAAANTYFGVPAAQLTAEQGAVLAVLIRSPSGNDPEINPEGAQERWGLVLDAMAAEGWLDDGARAAAVYPQVLPKAGSNLGIPAGPEGLVVQRALDELEAKGYDEQQIRAGGLRITTTVDKRAQDAALAAVADVMEGEPEGLREALVAIDPRTGAVRAYYGGPTGAGDGAIDYAQSQRQPGSSVKPYVLATALEKGISVTARRDGSSPQEFPDRPGLPVRNSGNVSCGSCTLMEAMTRSLNTTYYGLAFEVGPEEVRQNILEAAGLPETWGQTGSLLDGKPTLADPETGAPGASIGIGQYEMRPIDQAHGFATLASGGVEHEPFFVARVTDSEGALLLEFNGDAGDQVFPADVANDVTYALTDVAQYSRRALDGGREVAAKTGTQGLNDQDNSDAWMVGYTPSLSTAVWMGNDSPNDPIENASGAIIYGSGLPGAIWQQFMDTVLAGTPEEDLPDRPVIRGDTGRGVPAPRAEPRRETRSQPSTPAPQPRTEDGTGDGAPDQQPQDQPDAGQPNTGQPNTGQPNTGQPNTGQPNTGQPDTGQPNTGQPDTALPNTGQPNNGQPNTSGGQSAEPGQPAPEGAGEQPNG